MSTRGPQRERDRRREPEHPHRRLPRSVSFLRSRRVEPGGWVTLEEFWNAKGTAFFRWPEGATIRIRYGFGWLGTTSQEQTLDGERYARLAVGKGSVARARMQLQVPRATDVTYEVHPGGVGVRSPERRF